MRGIVAVIGFALVALSATPAFAECDLVPNGTTILAPETRPVGTVVYNSDYNVLQECKSNGEWYALHPFSSDPCTSGSLGTVCTSDGAVYAGTTVGGARLYVADADEDGYYTYGAYQTDLNGDDDSVPPELRDDGLANTNWLLAYGAGNHDAAQVCRDRGAGWYLPAIDELQEIYGNRAQLAAANLPTTDWYWSSSETDSDVARILRFSDGYWVSNYKEHSPYRVRCVRR